MCFAFIVWAEILCCAPTNRRVDRNTIHWLNRLQERVYLKEGTFPVGWEDLSLCSALKHGAVMSASAPWGVRRRLRAWLCALLVCSAVEKNTCRVLWLLPQLSYFFTCRWLVTYLASSAFNSIICVGRNEPFECVETSSCVGSNPEPIGWRELKHLLALGGLAIEPAWFKMVLCSWIRPVNPWKDDSSSRAPSGRLQQGPRASVARVLPSLSLGPDPTEG